MLCDKKTSKTIVALVPTDLSIVLLVDSNATTVPKVWTEEAPIRGHGLPSWGCVSPMTSSWYCPLLQGVHIPSRTANH